jgi:hypothetical protein
MISSPSIHTTPPTCSHKKGGNGNQTDLKSVVSQKLAVFKKCTFIIKLGISIKNFLITYKMVKNEAKNGKWPMLKDLF